MATDSESRAIIYQGATIPQLAAMFELKSADVLRKLANVAPTGKNTDGKDLYRVREAASQLARLPDNVVAQVMRLNHMDLPPMLRKEYWTGQNAMLKFLQAEGELWDTGAVVEYVAEAFKTIRMSLLLMTDTLERDSDLSETQRETLKTIIDSTLGDIRERLVITFQGRFTDDNGRPGGGRSTAPLAAEYVFPADTEGL